MRRKFQPFSARPPQLPTPAPPIIAPIQMPPPKPRQEPVMPPPPPPGMRSTNIRPPPPPSEVHVMVTPLRHNPTIVAEDPEEFPPSATPITLHGEAIEPIVSDEVPRPSLREAGICVIEEEPDEPTLPSAPVLAPSPARKALTAPQPPPPPPPLEEWANGEDQTPRESSTPTASKPPSQGIVPARLEDRASRPPPKARQRPRRSPPPWWKMTKKEWLIYLLAIGVVIVIFFRLLFCFSPAN